MPLITTQQFPGLAPTSGQALIGGLQVGQQIQTRRGALQQQAKEQQIRQTLGQIGQQQPLTQQQQMLQEQGAEFGEVQQPQVIPEQQLIQQARQIDPVIAEQTLKQLGLDDPTRRAEASRFAAQLQATPQDQRAAAIQKRVQSLQSQGRNPSDTLELLDMTPAEQNQALSTVQLLDLSTKERFALKAKGAEKVKTAKINEDGTTKIVGEFGTVKLLLPGETEKELIKQAQARKVELKGLETGEKEAAKAAIDQSVKAFKQLTPIRKNVRNIDRAITLLRDKGAKTGAVTKFFPSIQKASVELNNIQGQLGLDVIQNTTFGALSESELKFALDTALPTGLDEPELIEWLERKREAQSKLSDYLQESAIFLGTPGNTIPKFIQTKTAQRAIAVPPVPPVPSEEQTSVSPAPSVEQPSGVIRFDRAGKRIQ